MATKLFFTLIALMLLFASSETINLPDAFSAKAQAVASQKKEGSAAARKGTAAATKKKKTVTVEFDGLMVLRRVDNYYELGVLDEKTAPHHHFMVYENKKKVPPALISELMKSGSRWSLDIVSASGSPEPDIKPRPGNPCNRALDTKANTKAHAYAFCWIMDFENDFNGGKEVKMNAGKFKPIIRLNNGELYTKDKYPELTKDSAKGCDDYGFVAETLALNIQLAGDQTLQLRVDGKPAFTLSKNGDRATLINGPHEHEEMEPIQRSRDAKCPPPQDDPPSHFLYYYNLFNAPRHDIYNKPDAKLPVNPKPQVKITVPRQACGIVYLGVSSGPLP